MRINNSVAAESTFEPEVLGALTNHEENITANAAVIVAETDRTTKAEAALGVGIDEEAATRAIGRPLGADLRLLGLC